MDVARPACPGPALRGAHSRPLPRVHLMAVLVLAIGMASMWPRSPSSTLWRSSRSRPAIPSSLVRLERRSPNAYTDAAPYTSLLFYQKNAKTLSAVMGVMGVPPIQVDDDIQQASASSSRPTTSLSWEHRPPLAASSDPKRDGDPAAPPSVVISYGFWQRRFGGDPSVVGRIIHIDRKPATVVGVLPYAYASLGGQSPDIWMPIVQQPICRRQPRTHRSRRISRPHVGPARSGRFREDRRSGTARPHR